MRTCPSHVLKLFVIAILTLVVAPLEAQAPLPQTVVWGGGNYRLPGGGEEYPLFGSPDCGQPLIYSSESQTLDRLCVGQDPFQDPLYLGGGLARIDSHAEATLNGVLRARSVLQVSDYYFEAGASVNGGAATWSTVRLDLEGEGEAATLSVWYHLSGTLALYSGGFGTVLDPVTTTSLNWFGWSQGEAEGGNESTSGVLYMDFSGVSATGAINQTSQVEICCSGLSDSLVARFDLLVEFPGIQVLDGDTANPFAVWDMTLQGGSHIFNTLAIGRTLDAWRLVYDFGNSAEPLFVQAFDASGNDVTGLYRYAWSDGTSLAGGGPDATVPEPGTTILMLTGLLGLAATRLRGTTAHKGAHRC